MKGELYILRRNPPHKTDWAGFECEIFKLGMSQDSKERTKQNNNSYKTGQDPSPWERFITTVTLTNKLKAEMMLKNKLQTYKYILPDRSAKEMIAIPVDKKDVLVDAMREIAIKYKLSNCLQRDCIKIHKIFVWKGKGHPYLGKTAYIYSPQCDGPIKLIKGIVTAYNDNDEFLCVDEENDSKKYLLEDLEDYLIRPVLDWNKIPKVKLCKRMDMKEIAREWNLRGPVSLKNWFNIFEGVDLLDDVGKDENGYWARFKKGTWLPYPRDEAGNLFNYYLENCEAPFSKKKGTKRLQKHLPRY